MKFLVTWTWKVEDIEKCWKRYEEVREESYDYGESLYPNSLLVGSNKGFMVTEVNNMENFFKLLDRYSDLLIWEMHPILEVAEMYRLRK
jgi:hypothetical protein